MTPQIELDESTSPTPSLPPVRVRERRAGRHGRGSHSLVDADWEGRGPDALLLFVADEPGIGDRFAYAGATWEVVDYRDGWVARLVVA